MSTDRYLALEIGGSKIEAGVVTDGGRVIGKPARIPAQPDCTRDRLLADIHTALKQFLGHPVSGLGVGFPSRGNYTRGVPYEEQGARYPNMNGFPLREHLADVYGVPTEMNTDANMFALGVAHFGEGRSFRDFIALTVGTGIGVGVILARQIQQGDDGLPAKALKAVLRCNSRSYHLGANFKELYGLDGEQLATQARSGDGRARAALRCVGAALAETIRSLAAEYDVEAVILGGGVTQSYRFIKDAVQRGVRDTGIVVKPTRLPYPALAGAAAMFRPSAPNPPRPACPPSGSGGRRSGRSTRRAPEGPR